jgi:hypothetical protein
MTATIATKLTNEYQVRDIAQSHADALDHRVNEVEHTATLEDGSQSPTGHANLICLDCTVTNEHGKYRVVEDAQNSVYRLQTLDIEGVWTPSTLRVSGQSESTTA